MVAEVAVVVVVLEQSHDTLCVINTNNFGYHDIKKMYFAKKKNRVLIKVFISGNLSTQPA